MSHIVVYQADDGSAGFEPCNTLDDAVVVAERMRNVDGVETPRIFRMEEIEFDFRPYFRVEVRDAEAAGTDMPMSAATTDSVFEAIAASTTPVEAGADTMPAADTMPVADAVTSTPIDSLDRLEQSVEAFAADAATTDSIVEAATPEVEAEAVTVPDEPEVDEDPMVSVRRGLFGR